MISFGIVCWIGEDSEVPALKRCLDSVKDYPVILVNGKWNDMEGDNPISTQKARELIKSYDNIKYIESPNQSEAYNRNILYRECETEYLIWLDTDEWVRIEDYFKIDIKDRALIHYYDPGRGGYCLMPRVFRNPKRLSNSKYHNSVITQDMEDPPTGITIYSDRKYKSMKRRNAMFKRNKENPKH